MKTISKPNYGSKKNSVEFFAPMIPPTVTHNDLEPYKTKTGKVGIRKSQRLHEAEAKLEAHFAPHRPGAKLAGAIKATLCICYPIDKDHPRGLKVTPPDNDNLEKTIFDVMGRLKFFESGDHQIAVNHTTKCHDDRPGIYVALEEV